MNVVITAILALLEELLPALGNVASPTVQKVVAALVEIIPVVVKEAQDVVPLIKEVIDALTQNPNATPEDLAALAASNKTLDDAFEKVAAAADAEDAASDQPKG